MLYIQKKKKKQSNKYVYTDRVLIGQKKTHLNQDTECSRKRNGMKSLLGLNISFVKSLRCLAQVMTVYFKFTVSENDLKNMNVKILWSSKNVCLTTVIISGIWMMWMGVIYNLLAYRIINCSAARNTTHWKS
jgi:hypothetical protein